MTDISFIQGFASGLSFGIAIGLAFVPRRKRARLPPGAPHNPPPLTAAQAAHKPSND